MMTLKNCAIVMFVLAFDYFFIKNLIIKINNNQHNITKNIYHTKRMINRSKYMYKKENHIRFMLDSYDNPKNVPQEILDMIQRELEPIPNPTERDIRLILKTKNLYDYLTYIEFIKKKVLKQNHIITLNEKHECPICFEEIEKSIPNIVKINNCNHMLCIDCFNKIKSDDNTIQCPLCRKVNSSDILQNLDTKLKEKLVEQFKLLNPVIEQIAGKYLNGKVNSFRYKLVIGKLIELNRKYKSFTEEPIEVDTEIINKIKSLESELLESKNSWKLHELIYGKTGHELIITMACLQLGWFTIKQLDS